MALFLQVWPCKGIEILDKILKVLTIYPGTQELVILSEKNLKHCITEC